MRPPEGKQVQEAAEEHDEQDAEPEDRDRHADERDHRPAGVEDGVLLHRRHHAERMPTIDAKMIAAMASSIVAGKRAPISSETGVLV